MADSKIYIDHIKNPKSGDIGYFKDSGSRELITALTTRLEALENALNGKTLIVKS